MGKKFFPEKREFHYICESDEENEKSHLTSEL